MADAAGLVATLTSAFVGDMYNYMRRLVIGIGRKYEYAKNPQTCCEKMMKKANLLYRMEKDVRADADGDYTKQLSQECCAWIRRVDETKEEVKTLQREHSVVQSLKFFLRLEHSNRMVELSEELHALSEEGRTVLKTVRRPPEHVRPIEDAPETEDKPSLHEFVRDIIKLLNEQGVKRIGVSGLPGTGKTTIMQNVNNNKEIAKTFEIVIWVTVPKNPTIEKLQKVIAQRLKLKLEDNTCTTETAFQISERLKEARYLLLLDEFQRYFDLNGCLDLKELGISWDKQMDSRVVLATRDRGNYFDMGINQHIKVTQLSEDDAWKMFRKIVGQKIDDLGVEPIARRVVRECACIPLAIDKVAKTFSAKGNIDLWREGLRLLDLWGRKIQGMEELLDFLRVCYESLDGDRKVCFQYSALYPEDNEIFRDYLLECWRAEDFNHDQLHTILQDLIDLSLLEECRKKKHIRMNKVIREMALRIEGSKFLVRDAHKKSEEPPDEGEWVEANRISLMDGKLRRLPESPKCNNLLTLLLQNNSDLTVIPKLFFKNMQSLRVLDLHGIGITSLPACISSLTSVRALYLNSCKQLKILPPTVQALTVLELLDIQGTGIKKLPRKMVKLIGLRCLRISLSNFGAEYPNNHRVISSLCFLEELSIDVDSYQQWCDKFGKAIPEKVAIWETVGKAITEEVATLTKLTSLSFCFPDLDCLEIFITRNPSWRTNCLKEDNPFKFQFCVGSYDSTRYAILDDLKYGMDKCLKVVKEVGINVAISNVLKESCAFELIGHEGVSKLSDFGIENMNQMRVCLIEGCDEIKTIIEVNTRTAVLKCLKKMHVKNVSNLERIWNGPVHAESLVELTTLELYQCPKLKNLFSTGMIQKLLKLQHLNIEGCSDIEELIMESENSGLDSNALPSLKTLVLHGLPNLRNIWVDDALDWPSLEMIRITTCDSLIRLPFNDKNATRLRSIECEESWWNNLQQEVAIKQRVSEQKVLRLNPPVIVLLLHLN